MGSNNNSPARIIHLLNVYEKKVQKGHVIVDEKASTKPVALLQTATQTAIGGTVALLRLLTKLIPSGKYIPEHYSIGSSVVSGCRSTT